MEPKIFYCKHCGNIIVHLKSSGVNVVCCDEPMTALVANTVEASVEKHIPVVTVDGEKVHVAVGSEEHPMIEKHYIQWIMVVTEKGFQVKHLNWTDKPEACFCVCKSDKIVGAYAYCNIHGLWVSKQ